MTRKMASRVSIVLATAALCFAPTATAHALPAGPVIKLNGPLVQGGNVSSFEVSPDGKRALYRANQDVRNQFGVYSVSTSGGTPLRLDTPDPNVAVIRSAITPDSQRAVYTARHFTELHSDLYSVPLDGGVPTKLNTAPMNPDADFSFRFTPDASRVIFTADADSNFATELYSVPVTGGSMTMLRPERVGFTFAVSPDSSRAVYTASGPPGSFTADLYSVPVGGGPATKLNPSLPNGRSVSQFEITPDSSRVVYRADQDVDEAFEYYSVALAGGPVTKLNPSVGSGSAAGFSTFKITPDSARLIYRLDQQTPGVFDLYSVPVTGGPATKLNPEGTSAAGSGSFPDVGVTSDSSRVVFTNDEGGIMRMFSVATAGGPVTTLSPPQVKVSSANAISPDSSRVLYTAARVLYSVPIGGGPVAQLSPTVTTSLLGVRGGEFSPDGNWVVFNAAMDAAGHVELYRVAPGGGPVTKLSAIAPGGSISGQLRSNFKITSDSRRVVYQAFEGFFVDQLYSVSLPVEVPVDIKPQACPNGLNVRSKGVTPVAILGTAEFGVDAIDVSTVRLAGIAPKKSTLEDVGTPFTPLLGKTATTDCTTSGPDGRPDLVLQFDTEELATTLGPVGDGDGKVLTLTAKISAGGSVIGEDIVRIQAP